jgi:hypothetical protein
MGELLRQVTRGERTELMARRPDLPVPLLDLVHRLLQLDMQARPSDGRGVATALRAIGAAHWPAAVGAARPNHPE